MFGSYFTTGQQVVLLLSFSGALAAIALYGKGRSRWAIGLLTLSAFALRLFAAHLDPYLNEWDECFHALVAKNMMSDPFRPILHTLADLPRSVSWTEQQVWLHKPPFFLWQMALSLKVFGLHPWAVRVPSALWLAALVPVVYHMGCLLLNGRTAFIAALFTGFSYYFEELTAAGVCNDSNDAVVIATVACSWWALLEYWRAGTWRWALLTGLFSACAVLTKWYIGFSVFVPWGVVLLHRWKGPGELVRYGAACLLPVVLSGAWIAYTFHRFPVEAAYEWGTKPSHISASIAGHAGSVLYHFEVIDKLIPPFTWWLMVPAYAWLVWSARSREHRLLLVVLFVSVHLAFGIAKTKMLSYTLVLYPVYMIAMAHALATIVEHIIVERYRTLVLWLSTLLLSALMLDLERLQYRHTVYDPPKSDQCWQRQQLGAVASMEQLFAVIKDPEHSVVFNIPGLHHIQFMFRTGIEAWNTPPAAEDVARLRAKGYSVFVLQDGSDPNSFPAGITLIPDTVVRYPDIGRPVD